MAVPPIAPHGIHHLAIQCHDLVGMVRFYQRVLRLPIVKRWPSEDPNISGDRAVWLGLGQSVLVLERAADAPNPQGWQSPDPGMHLLALHIFPWNRRLWAEHLSLYEVQIVHQSQWTLYLRDPEGNRVGLSHYPEVESEVQRSQW
ncbi:MAG TPA: glyoxalase [Myxococcales bacterium]|nr:glyoxalase [Myxococcales bacterium]HAN31756.1 glyoxalase [Myxococcales bacterium]|tara:strand:- start:56 stop:490 length:435 start_codon:yes stop_codon:yes gene_type:complete